MFREKVRRLTVYTLFEDTSFGWLRETMRDKARDKLCAGLCEIGVNARMAERGRPEDKTGEGSLGIIEIGRSPIRWANVRKENHHETTIYFTEFGVPDARRLTDLRIRPVRVRSFPVFGRVIEVRWEGDDRTYGIGQQLSQDQVVKNLVIDTDDDVTVVARPDHGCWLIRRETAAAPSAGQWRCYQAVAGRLLAARLPGPEAADSNQSQRKGRSRS